MEDRVHLRTYTVSNLRDWLIHNHAQEGLSTKVISPARAYSIVNNPYVKDEMKVLCAVFVNDKVAAFTAAFPDILEKPKGQLAWWFTTLWCDPTFQGRGFGLIVVGTLAEEYGIGNCYDAEGAPETIEILKILGLKTKYYSKYVFEDKFINTDSIKGKLAKCADILLQCRKLPYLRHIVRNIAKMGYTLNYSNFVDDEAYSFMCRHSQETFYRSQETLNWILQYPFMQESPLASRVSRDNPFSSTIESYSSFLLKVYNMERLVAVSLIVLSRNYSMSVKYLYYDSDFHENTFAALLEHALKYRVRLFSTVDKKLADYIYSKHLFTKSRVQSFSFSSNTSYDGASLQGGIGDMFV